MHEIRRDSFSAPWQQLIQGVFHVVPAQAENILSARLNLQAAGPQKLKQVQHNLRSKARATLAAKIISCVAARLAATRAHIGRTRRRAGL